MARRRARGIPDALKNFDLLPDSAYVRQPVVEALFACSAATIWRRVRDGRYSGFGYTTASHTPEKPRLRFILEASREIDREEGMHAGAAVQQRIDAAVGAGKINWDESVYRGEQPCFTPLTNAQVYRFEGIPVDVDALLAEGCNSSPERPSAQERASAAAESDPVLARLSERSMVRRDMGAGKFAVTCPFEAEHTEQTGDSSTVYYLPHFGGYKFGNFKCLHQHCAKRSQEEFLKALDLDPRHVWAEQAGEQGRARPREGSNGSADPSQSAVDQLDQGAESDPADIIRHAIGLLAQDPGAVLVPEVIEAWTIVYETDHAQYARLRADAKAAKAPLGEIDKAIGIRHKFARGARRPAKKPGSDGRTDGQSGHSGRMQQDCPYVVESGAIHRSKETSEGPVLNPLCNFDARIVQEVIHDNGAETESRFLIEGRTADGRVLQAVEVPTASFPGMSWVAANWGNAAIVFAGQTIKDHLRCGIQQLSGEVSRVTVFAHAGWRRIDGAWHYLHAAGAITENSNRNDLRIELDGRLRHYALPEPPQEEALVHALRASLRLADAHPTAGPILLIAAYRAPLGEALRVDFSLFVGGGTGAQKTALTAAAHAHFGTEFSAYTLPANWEDTENDLECKGHAAKDTLFGVDDFKPKGAMHDIQRLHAKADRVLRGAANQAGRGRRMANMRGRPDYFPRGLVVASGEDIPRGQSLRARLCIVEMRRGEVDLGVLGEIQAHAASGALSAAMSGYLRWLAPKIDALKAALPQLAREYRNAAGSYAHPRAAEVLASLRIGIETLIEFALSVLALSPGEAAALSDRLLGAVRKVMDEQDAYQEDADEVTRFLALLGAVLSSDRAHLCDAATNGAPTESRRWGWRTFFVREGDHDVERWRPLGSRIGWVDDRHLYLEPEATFAAVQELAREQNESFAITRCAWIASCRPTRDAMSRSPSSRWTPPVHRPTRPGRCWRP